MTIVDIQFITDANDTVDKLMSSSNSTGDQWWALIIEWDNLIFDGPNLLALTFLLILKFFYSS